MIRIIGIDHIVLRTSKLDDILDFYIEILACKVERKTPKESGLTQIRAGNALIDLVVVDSSLGQLEDGALTRTEINVDHFCLQKMGVSQAFIVRCSKDFPENSSVPHKKALRTQRPMQ